MKSTTKPCDGVHQTLRTVTAVLEEVRPHRLEERHWHEVLAAAIHEQVGCHVLLSLRVAREWKPGVSITDWLMKQGPVGGMSISLADQAQLAVFLSPRSPKTVWLNHRLLRIEHCSTPLGEVVGLLYCLPRSQALRCTLFCQINHDASFGQWERLLARQLARHIMTGYARRYYDPVGDRLQELSPREMETLQLILQGRNENQIAQKMVRSTHTVHSYIKSLYTRFAVSSRAELLAHFIDFSDLADGPLTRRRRRVSAPTAVPQETESAASTPARNKSKRLKDATR